MLIKELIHIDIDDILKESDEFALKSAMDAIILEVKDKLMHNSDTVITLDAVIAMLNARSQFLAIDPKNDDRRNVIMQAFEEHDMSVERGSGRITLHQMDATKTDDGEREKAQKTQEVGRKAMDNIKKKSETGGSE